jgi:hypothetical protein
MHDNKLESSAMCAPYLRHLNSLVLLFLMCCCRFQKALESAKHDEDMWVLLANANIHDAKARKVRSTLGAAAAAPGSEVVRCT